MKDKKLNVRPDPPDFRDREYTPILTALEPRFNNKPFSQKKWPTVKNQGRTSACTGFALSSMVEILTSSVETTAKSKVVQEISPYMLYYFARRYDRFPGIDPEFGSSARGAMKSWSKHGACPNKIWKALSDDPSTIDQKWAAEAFKKPLGAYYRVNHKSITDIHAAINETGVVYASAMTHVGWGDPDAEGNIVYLQGNEEAGGHAFLIVGYDEYGFWIQNSWSTNWGKKGFARISYLDWNTNAMDTWVAQLGVQISQSAKTLQDGLSINVLSQADSSSLDYFNFLSSSKSVRDEQLSPYVVNLHNDGELSNQGRYRTEEKDLELLVTRYLDKAVSQFGLNGSDKIDIALYAHGGLVDEKSAEKTARCWIPSLFRNQIFPIFFMWETGPQNVLWDLFDEWLKQKTGAAGNWFTDFIDEQKDKAENWIDQRVESAVSNLGTTIWDEMKENARLASEGDLGGVKLLLDALTKNRNKAFLKRIRFHLIGHSAGSIFHGHVVHELMERNLTVDGVYFMAPACRVDFFKDNFLPYYENGEIKKYTQFHLYDNYEQDDDCHPLPYNKSLLYLVSNSFEYGNREPLLGMANYFEKDPELAIQKPGWEWIKTPYQGSNPYDQSDAYKHGGFGENKATRNSIIHKIANRTGGSAISAMAPVLLFASNGGGNGKSKLKSKTTKKAKQKVAAKSPQKKRTGKGKK